MAKKKATGVPPKLDPILPLPAGTEIPPVRQGEGKEIMQNDKTMIVSMPYRAFYLMWEQAERRARENYPKYVGGQLDHHARASLEAVHAFRSAARGEDLPILPEKKAQKARKIRAKMEAEAATAKKSGDKKETKVPTKIENECTSVKKGVHCLGPAKHKGKHRGKTKSGRKVAWSD